MGDAARTATRACHRPARSTAECTQSWIERAVRMFYVHPRTVGRRAQLCLRDPEGRELGWRDVASGRVMVRAGASNSPLALAILRAARPAPLPLLCEHLPGIALDMPGGSVLAQLRLRSAAILVGKESGGPEDPGRGDRRLYATLARPGKDTATLGYVDLRTGVPHLFPGQAPFLDSETAAQLLHAIADGRPSEHVP